MLRLAKELSGHERDLVHGKELHTTPLLRRHTHAAAKSSAASRPLLHRDTEARVQGSAAEQPRSSVGAGRAENAARPEVLVQF